MLVKQESTTPRQNAYPDMQGEIAFVPPIGMPGAQGVPVVISERYSSGLITPHISCNVMWSKWEASGSSSASAFF